MGLFVWDGCDWEGYFGVVDCGCFKFFLCWDVCFVDWYVDWYFFWFFGGVYLWVVG